jgi:ribosome-associated protein
MRINGRLTIADSELELSFQRSPGPGGQNVNKVATAVEVRFDVRRSSSLPAAVKARLEALAGQRLTQDGVLVMAAHRYRSQARNREDALARLAELMRRAAVPPKPRRATQPTAASKRRHFEAKRRRGQVKQARRPAGAEE